MTNLTKPSGNEINYIKSENLLQDAKIIIDTAQDYAYKAVNFALVKRNWLLGKRIAEEELQNENRIDELIRAAEAGDAKAQAHLGWCYNEGEGVEVDHEKAFYWYTRSAEAGNATAQFNLAMCYELGTGVRKNMALAVKWYTIKKEDFHLF